MNAGDKLEAVLCTLAFVAIAALALAALVRLLHAESRIPQPAPARRAFLHASRARRSPRPRAPLYARLWRTIRAAGTLALLRATCLAARTLAPCRLAFLDWAD